MDLRTGKRYRTKKERIRMEKAGLPYCTDGSLDYSESEYSFLTYPTPSFSNLCISGRPLLYPLHPSPRTPVPTTPRAPLPHLRFHCLHTTLRRPSLPGSNHHPHTALPSTPLPPIHVLPATDCNPNRLRPPKAPALDHPPQRPHARPQRH